MLHSNDRFVTSHIQSHDVCSEGKIPKHDKLTFLSVTFCPMLMCLAMKLVCEG